MKRYYNHNVDDAERIAVVEADTDEGFETFARDQEIAASDLPTDFAEWQRYAAFSHGNNAVYVMSRDGG